MIFNILNSGAQLILTHATAVLGFILALLVTSRAFREKKRPGNFFAWFFFVLFVPLIAGPLYLIFGGRKSRKTTQIKRRVTQEALALSGSETHDSARIAIDKTAGNKITLLPNGEVFYDRICQEIKEAKTTIHIATYIFGKGAPATKIAELLAQQARNGLTVRLLLDSLGCWNTTRRLRCRLRSAGVEVAMFMPVIPFQTHSNANLRNHRKLAIFDHRCALVGGHNIDRRFIGANHDPTRFADLSVAISGPAVAHLSRTFIADWAFATRRNAAAFKPTLEYQPEKRGNSAINVIASGPDVPNDPLWEQILLLINTFKEQLTIITPYFIPDEVIFQTLIVQARSKKKIRIILPLRSNHAITDIARHNYLEGLHEAGVEIRFFTERMLHAKLTIADDSHALLGSANIDMRSLFLNFEIGLLHHAKSDITALTAWADSINEKSIDYEAAIKKEGFLPSRTAASFVRLIEPLL